MSAYHSLVSCPRLWVAQISRPTNLDTPLAGEMLGSYAALSAGNFFFFFHCLPCLLVVSWKNPPAFAILTTFLREWRSDRYAWMSKYMHTASCICSPGRKKKEPHPAWHGMQRQSVSKATSTYECTVFFFLRYIELAIIIQTGR